MVYLLIAVTIWSCSYGLVKQNLTGIDPYFASCLRLVLASGFFLPFFRKTELTWTAGLRFFLIGGFQYGLMYCFYLQAVHYLNAYEVALFTLFVPLYINLVEDIYARRFHASNWALAFLGMGGAMIVKYQTPVWEHLRNGFLLMQAANFLFAWGMVEYRYLRRRLPLLKDHQIYMLPFMGAAAFAAVATTLAGGWASYALLDWPTIKALVYLSFVATGIGFFAWYKGATIANPGTTAVMSLLKVPMGVLASIFLFGETTDMLRLGLGLGVVCLAIGLSEWLAAKHKKMA